MGHPALTELHHLLDSMRLWANEALTGYQEPANRGVAVWNLVRDAQGVVSCETHLPYTRCLPTSAHAMLAVESTMRETGAKLADLCTQAGLLDVGLGWMNISVTSSTQAFKHLVMIEHSGVRLWPTDKGLGTEKAMTYLRRAFALLARVPMDASAPLKAYEVDAYRVAAPDARTATALHLVQHDPNRLERILTQGPNADAKSMQLRVLEIITKNGETLFANL